MPVMERYPTTTTVVAAGWVDPTNAYIANNTYTYTETTLAQQVYAGYGNFLSGNEVIDKVFLSLKSKVRVTGVNTGDSAIATGVAAVYDGATWSQYQVIYESYVVSTASDESMVINSGNDSNTMILIDVTPQLDTLAKLSQVQTSIAFAVAADAGLTVRWSVDAVGIIVCYHIPGSLFGAMKTGAAKTKSDLDTKENRAVKAVTESLAVTS